MQFSPRGVFDVLARNFSVVISISHFDWALIRRFSEAVSVSLPTSSKTMMWKEHGCTLLVLLCLLVRVASSLVHQKHDVAFARRPATLPRLNLSTEVEEKTVLPTTLTFRGELTLNSNPGKAVDIEKIIEFFQNPEHRNLLVTAGGSRPASELSVTGELFNEWKKAASKVGATAPVGGAGEALLIVETGGIRFPGLTVISNAILGSKTFVLNHTPMYEFVLIKDEQSVEGLPPVVWIYKQLTGSGNKESASETSARSLRKVTVDVDEAGKELKFKSVSSLEVAIKIPSLLLRILPVSKEKAEEQGSAAVLKAVEVDASKGIAKFKEAYDAWVSNS
jgi:hypothetical protein